jgi:hypothetical protein
MKIINYTKIFREDCIKIFKSNMPKYFALEELPLFESFLDQYTEENYFVVKMDGHVIGCGGFFWIQRIIWLDYHGEWFTPTIMEKG